MKSYTKVIFNQCLSDVATCFCEYRMARAFSLVLYLYDILFAFTMLYMYRFESQINRGKSNMQANVIERIRLPTCVVTTFDCTDQAMTYIHTCKISGLTSVEILIDCFQPANIIMCMSHDMNIQFRRIT
jgi:hypothetical protein